MSCPINSPAVCACHPKQKKELKEENHLVWKLRNLCMFVWFRRKTVIGSEWVGVGVKNSAEDGDGSATKDIPWYDVTEGWVIHRTWCTQACNNAVRQHQSLPQRNAWLWETQSIWSTTIRYFCPFLLFFAQELTLLCCYYYMKSHLVFGYY